MIVSVNIMGGLGNQLFQIAAAYAYSKKENGILQIFKKIDNGNRPTYWDTICKKINKYLVSQTPILEHWYEDYPTMYKEIGTLTIRGKHLMGYMQTSKYFYNFRDEIKELFKQTLPDELKNKYKVLFDNSERVVVIHARRTDYITSSNVHGPLNGQYYKDALKIILEKIENPIFVLASDDSAFWAEIKNDIEPAFNNYTIINDTDINTFILLQQFNNFIMSNSTFIWWVVWLADAKNVIVPSKWFGPDGPSKYNDIYEDNWIKI